MRGAWLILGALLALPARAADPVEEARELLQGSPEGPLAFQPLAVRGALADALVQGEVLWLLTRDGTVARVALPSLREERHLPLGRRTERLALSKAGLVIAGETDPGSTRLTVVDPATLKLLCEVDQKDAKFLAATPGSPVGWVIGENWKTLLEVDLSSGKPGRKHPLERINDAARKKLGDPRGGIGIVDDALLTPDGKALLLADLERVWRLKLGKSLAYDGATPRREGAVSRGRLRLSPDGALLLTQYGVHAYPALGAPQWRTPALAIDEQGRGVGLGLGGDELLVTDARGFLTRSWRLPEPKPGPGEERVIRLSHPSEVLALSPAAGLLLWDGRGESAAGAWRVTLPAEARADGSLPVDGVQLAAAVPGKAAGAARSVDRVEVTALETPEVGVHEGRLALDPRGPGVLYQSHEQRLLRVGLEQLEQLAVELPGPVRGLGVAASAVLVQLDSPQGAEVWVLDPATLALRGRIPVPGIQSLVASAHHRHAWARVERGGDGWVLLDLSGFRQAAWLDHATIFPRGAKVKLSKAYQPDRKTLGEIMLSPDGKTALGVLDGALARLRVQEDGQLLLEEVGPTLVPRDDQAGAIALSPDGKLAALPCWRGNTPPPGLAAPPGQGTVLVVETANLEKVRAALPFDGPALALAFDPRGGAIYGGSQDARHLIVFDPTGKKLTEHVLCDRNLDRVERLLAVEGAPRLIEVVSRRVLRLNLPADGLPAVEAPPPPAAPKEGQVALRWAWKVGQVLRRTFRSAWEGEGRWGKDRTENGSQDQIVLEDRVVAVEKDGSARLERTLRRIVRRYYQKGMPDGDRDQTWDTDDLEGSRLQEKRTHSSLGDDATAALVGKPVELVLDPWGRLVTMQGRRPDRVEGPQVRLRPGLLTGATDRTTVHELPAQPLAPGESWTETCRMKRQDKEVEMTLRVTLDAVEVRDGRRVAVCSVALERPAPAQEYQVRGRREFDLELGIELLRTCEVDEVQTIGGTPLGFRRTGEQRTELLPAGKR